MNPDELSSEAPRTPTAVGEEEESISSFEEAFQHAKEATGVTDSQVRADSINREAYCTIFDIQNDQHDQIFLY